MRSVKLVNRQRPIGRRFLQLSAPLTVCALVAGVMISGTRAMSFSELIRDVSGLGAAREIGDDPDGDGISNGLEILMGLDPANNEANPVEMKITDQGFELIHPEDASVSDQFEVAYTWSTDLESFHLGGYQDPDGVSVKITVQKNGGGPGLTKVTGVVSGDSQNKSVFARIELAPKGDLLDTTNLNLQSFYQTEGGRNAFLLSHLERLEAFVYGQQDLEAGNLDQARARVDQILAKYPLDSSWPRSPSAGGANYGTPVAYSGLRMLDQILELGDPSGKGTLTMTAVVAPSAVVTTRLTPDGPLEQLDRVIDERILAREAKILHESTKLFRRWLRAITGGYDVELQVHVMDTGTRVGYSDDASRVISYPQYQEMVDSVPGSVADQTDLWWVIAPSGVPGDGRGFGRHFITGGMTADDFSRPIFISDDAWFTRKIEHLGEGSYSVVELQAYQPQWFQHEFMHHVYKIYPEFNLEPTSHSWFNRRTWPSDFVGSHESDYYYESIKKRILGAANPLIELLRPPIPNFLEPTPENLSQIVGSYRHLPTQNDWHIVTITLENGRLRWTNAAGRSWLIELESDGLVAPSSPYGRRRVNVVLDDSGTTVESVTFNGGTYLAVQP